VKSRLKIEIIMEEMFINIEYTFSSSLGVDAEYKYIKVVKGKVFNGEFADNTENEFIGQIVFKILSLDEAKQDGFDIYQIFDNHEYTFRHGKSFYNFLEFPQMF